MLDLVTLSVWARDLPVCFPGRACVDVPPGGAQSMYLISDLTSASPGIAAALWAGLGITLVPMSTGIWRHWRGSRLRPGLVLLAVAVVVSGAALTWSMGAWLGEAALVYSGEDGRPAASIPANIIGSWPLVQAAGYAGLALGAIALFLVLNTTAVYQHRAARASGGNLR